MPTFNDNNNPNQISNTEKEHIRQYFLDNDIKEIRLEKGKLIITHNNNNTNSEPNKGNNQLAIGLAIGAGAVILIGIITYFIQKKAKKNKK